MKFVYYLAAIGHRGLDVKLNILAKNLKYIYSELNTNFDIVINCYNSEDVINNFMQQFTFINKKMVHNKPGVLTELFLTNPHNAALSAYDYILFMLDDVEIQEMHLRDMIRVKEKYNIEILSPKVINSSHAFMNSYNKNILTLNNALEVYCLLLKYKDFQRFLSIHTLENKWMWGADFLFGYFNIISGVYHKYSVKHMLLPSKKNKNNAERLMWIYLKQVNFYGSIKDIVPVNNIINLRTGASTKEHKSSDTGKLMRTNFRKNKLNSNDYSIINAPIISRQAANKPLIKLLGKIQKSYKYRNPIIEFNTVNYVNNLQRLTKNSVSNSVSNSTSNSKYNNKFTLNIIKL